jgi:hypothetical protein
MRKALPAAAIVAVALTLFGAVPAFATPTATATATATGTTTTTTTNTTTATSTSTGTATNTGTTTTTTPPPPGTTTGTTTATGQPTSIPSSTDTSTTQPTTTSETTSAAPTTSITDIDVDVDIDDRDDYSITNISNLTIEGDTYNNTYVYTGADGRTYRGTNLSCFDFTTIDDAQRVLDDLGGYAYLLDSDFDGIACEPECGEFIRNTGYDLGIRYNRGGQVDVWPTGAIDTGLAA